MPKLLNREPTPVQVRAGQIGVTTTCAIAIYQAMYDAAPEVKHEPVGEMTGHHPVGAGEMPTILWRDGYWPVIGTKLYTFPPGAQAEIERRDARIAELEQQLSILRPNKSCDSGCMLSCSMEGAAQAAEISRLRKVLAKCRDGIEGSLSDCLPYINKCKEALAAIKEERL